jgi:hypothetical protein
MRPSFKFKICFLLFYILIGRTFPVKVLLLILSFVLEAHGNGSFSKKQPPQSVGRARGTGANRGQLVIVSFAPFHPATGQSLASVGG